MERWDVYDRAGNRLPGYLIRGEAIPEGQYHLVCDIVVRHEDGDFLLMRRSPEKEHYPNIWEIGAGGSALAGEDAWTGARRELREETGIDRGELTYTGRHVSSNTIYEGFLCVTDFPKNQITLQEGETVDYRWLSREAFLAFFRSDECIDLFKERLAEFVAKLEAEA